MAPFDFIRLRDQMIHEQLEQRNITDQRVLATMRDVPRHAFVPEELQHLAYSDNPLPIGQDQTISQPFIVAYMIQSLELRGDETILEIGTGSGYQTALLCKLVHYVITMERHTRLAEVAAQNLDKLGIENVEIHEGDGSQGLPDMAPFDAIIVSAAAPAVPQTLLAQLAEGGRMVIPVGDPQSQYLQRAHRLGNTWHIEQLMPVVFVPLIGRFGFGQRAAGPTHWL